MQVQSLDWEDALEKEITTHSSIFAWEIPWKEEPEVPETEVGSHSLLQVVSSFLQDIFPTQRSNPGLLHCGKMLYCLSH